MNKSKKNIKSNQKNKSFNQSNISTSSNYSTVLKFFNNTLLLQLVLTIILSGIVAIFIYLLNSFSSPSLTIVLSFALLTIGMNLTVYILKRKGYALLFYLFLSVFTFNLLDLGIIGWKKILTLFIAGTIFELILLIPLIKSFSSKVVLATIISITSIPFFLAFLVSKGLAVTFPLPLVNLILIAFIISGLSSALSLIIWIILNTFKPIIKLQSYLETL